MKKVAFAVFLFSFGFVNVAFGECDLTGSYAVKKSHRQEPPIRAGEADILPARVDGALRIATRRECAPSTTWRSYMDRRVPLGHVGNREQ